MDRRLAIRATQILVDLGVLSIAFWLAVLLRFDWQPPYWEVRRAIFLWSWVVGFQYGLLALFSVPRFSWRYVSLREATRITTALTVALLVLVASRLIFHRLTPTLGAAATYAFLPLGVLAIDYVLAVLGTTGVRVLRRLAGEHHEAALREVATQRRRVLLIGAGSAGQLAAKEVAARPDLGLLPVGFLDDDPAKQGTLIHGIPVLGPVDQLPARAQALDVDEVLITIANAPGSAMRRFSQLCERAGILPKVIPGIYEIIGGQVNLSRIRTVEVRDLLGREPVQLDQCAIAEWVADRVVLVTGAGGSIGSELCHQLARFGPRLLVLVDQAEPALYRVERAMHDDFPEQVVEPSLADVTDADRIDALFARYRPAVVFHAAAHKHVPLMEQNPGEAVKNNIDGTRVVAAAADRHSVRCFVQISTDKAVNPSSVMGATKRVAELYVHALSRRSATRYVIVRFGNVLGSDGSVIPRFQQQIARGGPVTVTHPAIERFFMTVPEACQLVLQAGSMGQGGEIFVLDMGEPVKILDLACSLITLSGLKPQVDIPITFTGLRPGEKLFEELTLPAEQATKTRHPKIYVGRVEPRPFEEIEAGIDAALEAAANDPDQVRARLRDLVPEYVTAPRGGLEREAVASNRAGGDRA